MLKKNLAPKKLKAGKAVIGVRMDFPSPYVLELVGTTGFDFVYFDCEHSSLSVGTCEEMIMIRATELVGLAPLVRVPSNKPGVILRYLVSGGMGVIIPHSHNREASEKAIRAVKYHSEGDRGIAGRSLSLSGLSVAN